ncbi:fluoride efflux transporter FluC [Halosimplex aquaticum]|uniref:Fluoride-specific ion channel FluC n=1 Tax=Halosimplex aquaticum TaxID=3026162 RepID=A0ABD5Y3N1_9EURY|nr:CrcB family protein [Halosimplex aquaticum]
MRQTHPLEHVETILIIAVGGFAGANLRYFVELTLPSSLAATMTVNVLGSMALGFLFYENILGDTISESGRAIMATGFISSFTTYSTFIIDAISTTPLVGVGYVITSYGLGFTAVVVGRASARRVTASNQLPLEVSD